MCEFNLKYQIEVSSWNWEKLYDNIFCNLFFVYFLSITVHKIFGRACERISFAREAPRAQLTNFVGTLLHVRTKLAPALNSVARAERTSLTDIAWRNTIAAEKRRARSHSHEQVNSLFWTTFFNLKTFLNHIVNYMCTNEFRAYNFCANYNFLDFTRTYEFRTHAKMFTWNVKPKI